MIKYIKVVDGVIEKYPYTFHNLKIDNPNVSFPANYSDPNGLASYDVYVVTETSEPDYDRFTQTVNEIDPVLQEGEWVQTYEVIDLPLSDVELIVRRHRNALLRSTDYRALSDNNISQEWIDYRQALRDITAQEGFPYSVEWPIEPTT